MKRCRQCQLLKSSGDLCPTCSPGDYPEAFHDGPPADSWETATGAEILADMDKMLEHLGDQAKLAKETGAWINLASGHVKVPKNAAEGRKVFSREGCGLRRRRER